MPLENLERSYFYPFNFFPLHACYILKIQYAKAASAFTTAGYKLLKEALGYGIPCTEHKVTNTETINHFNRQGNFEL